MVGRALTLVLVGACSPGVGANEDMQVAPDARVMMPNDETGLERFIGRVAMSPTVEFGGSPYCTYSMTLKNIVVDATVHAYDGLVTTVVTARTTEAIVGSCPYEAAAPTTIEVFHSGTPRVANVDGTFVPDLDGIPGNNPRVEATAIVTRVKDTQLTATVTWHRIDQGPPLDWQVMTPQPVILDRVTCETDDVYCLGGSVTGAEYACGDGLHLYELKPCTSGCGPTTLPPAAHEDERCK